jgi:hypothetical protein
VFGLVARMERHRHRVHPRRDRGFRLSVGMMGGEDLDRGACTATRYNRDGLSAAKPIIDPRRASGNIHAMGSAFVGITVGSGA